MPRIQIAPVADVPEGRTKKFQFTRNGKSVEGFIACFRGRLVAYENVCRHIPLTLDYADNRFFTDDQRHFICRTHGALYEPHSGLCVEGPCRGERLFPLEIEISEETIWLKI